MATVYRNRQLMYLSAVLFFYFGSIGCLTPFLTSHMRHLGFSLTEISFINAVSAFFSLIGPMLCGTFAERRSRYKSTTVFCIIVGALAYIAISFVPRFDKLNYRPLVDFDCDTGLRVERCVNWATCGEALNTGDNLTKVKLSDCHYQCARSGHFVPTYPLHICFQSSNAGNICVVYDAERNDTSLTDFESRLMSWRFEEVSADPNQTSSGSSDVLDVLEEEEEEAVPRAHVAMCNFKPTAPIDFGGKQYEGISCRPTKDECSIHCKVGFTSGGTEVFPRSCEEAFGNPTTTFWVYLVLRSVGDLCLLTTICLLDAITIWSTIDYEGAYGRIHVWAALGMATMAPLSGTLLDVYSDVDGGRSDFSLSTYMAAALSLISCALMFGWPFHRQKSSQFQQVFAPTKDVKFCSVEMVIFLAIVIILGVQWSVMYTFLPWLASEIGCSFLMVGLGVTLMFGFSVPFLLISKNMIRNIGKANLLVFAMLFYFTRFAGVTFVSSPWWTLPFALMGSFTLCMMWIATVAYGQGLAPSGYNLIMQYMLNMLHFGLGRGIGSLLGGTLISSYTQRVVFCGIAVFSAILAFVYLTVYHVGLRKSKKGAYPNLLNGTWYPLRERYPNGDAKAHQPIVVDQDDDVNSSPNQSPNGK